MYASDYRYVEISRGVYLVIDEADASIMGLWGRVSSLSSLTYQFIPYPDSNWVLWLFSGCILSFPNSGLASDYLVDHFKH